MTRQERQKRARNRRLFRRRTDRLRRLNRPICGDCQYALQWGRVRFAQPQPRPRCNECRMLSRIQMGDRVMMTERLKELFRKNGSSAHVREFGNSVGIVQGLTQYGKKQLGPEVDVWWLPKSGRFCRHVLRYAYDPEYLETVG